MSQLSLPSEILSEKDVRLIVKSINDSKQQYENWNNERKLGYENGKYLDRWNYIFANIERAFSYKPFITYHVSRGKLWEFAVIYNTETKILYLILREDTFKLISRRKDNPYHYVRVLNSKNFKFQKEVVQKINMFTGYEPITNEYIDEDFERMINEIKNEVKGCVNILFKENITGVYKITANFANYDLEIFKTYDLSKYITADIDDISDTKINFAPVLPKIELNIRKDKLKIKKEELVEDKNRLKKEIEEKE